MMMILLDQTRIPLRGPKTLMVEVVPPCREIVSVSRKVCRNTRNPVGRLYNWYFHALDLMINFRFFTQLRFLVILFLGVSLGRWVLPSLTGNRWQYCSWDLGQRPQAQS